MGWWRVRGNDGFRTKLAISGQWGNPRDGTRNYSWSEFTSTTGQKTVVSDMAGKRPKLTLRRPVINEFILTRSSRSMIETSLAVGPYSEWGGYWANGNGDWTALVERKVPWTEVLNADVEKLKSLALTRAYAKVNDTPVMAGEILWELEKTLSMFRRPFSSSIRLLEKMFRRRGILRKSSSLARANANTWLEYRYGWRPIIGDIRTIISECHKIFESADRFLVARTSERDSRVTSKVFSDVDLGVTLSGAGNTKASGAWTVSETVRACAGVTYQAKCRPPDEAFLAFFGLRGRDLPATVWELVPFSFVADWFGNIGSWLQAITPDPYVAVTGNWVTVVRNTEIKYDPGILYEQFSTPVARSQGTYGGSVIKNDEVHRYPNLPAPSTPLWKGKDLSIAQTVDALALSVQQIAGKLGDLRH